MKTYGFVYLIPVSLDNRQDKTFSTQQQQTTSAFKMHAPIALEVPASNHNGLMVYKGKGSKSYAV
jgi:hypothetical protein